MVDTKFSFAFLLLYILLAAESRCFTSRVKRETRNGTEYNSTFSHDVIIIGAGISGLSAAVELYTKYDIRNITILEARNRIGGRIYTMQHDNDSFVEFGAQQVHGESGHPLMDFISGNDLFLPGSEHPFGNESLYDLNGTAASFDIVGNVGDIFLNPFTELIEKNATMADVANVSLGDLLKAGFAKWLRNNSGNGDLKEAIFNVFYNDACLNSSEDLTKIALAEDAYYEDVQGNYASLIKGGYSNLLTHMTARVPLTSLVKFGAVVTQINYNASCSAGPVVVHLSDCHEVVGRTAIVTLPLGVLKAGSVEFIPPLPEAKQRAIKRLGFGCANKIFLFYKQRWWGDNVAMLPLFLDSIPDGINMSTNLYANAEEMKWYRKMVGFDMPYGSSLMLQAWLTGDSAKLVERLPLQEVTSVMSQIIKRAFGKDFRVEEPLKVEKTGWCNDTFTMGGYPFASMGSQVGDFKVMSEPVPVNGSNIFFAGDATSHSMWQSVHGAWATGVRAAEEVFRKLRKNN